MALRPKKGIALRLKIRTVAVTAAVTPVLAVPSAAAAATVIGSGSSAEQPVLTALFAGYAKVHRNVHFVYTADGGNAGVKDVQQRRSQFAVNTQAPLPSDSGTVQYKLFLDGLCVAVNKANSVSNVPLTRAANIFLGVFTSWSQVSGSGLTTTIDPIGRNSAAGSYTFFQQAVLKGQTQASNVEQLSSDGPGRDRDQARQERNRIRRSGSRRQEQRNQDREAKRRRLQRDADQVPEVPARAVHLGVLSLKHPNSAAAQFFDWVRTSSAAGKIVAKSAVPAFNKK